MMNVKFESVVTFHLFSLKWSDRTQGKEDQIAARYSGPRKFLDSIQHGGHRTDIVALLAARDDVAIIEKTRYVARLEFYFRFVSVFTQDYCFRLQLRKCTKEYSSIHSKARYRKSA